MKTSNLRPLGRHMDKVENEMRKDTKENNLGKADTVSKYECVGRQRNGEDFLIRQALRGGNVYE